MQKPFDIPADLHTPVSAYLRLAPLRPRYLLESVEEGYQGRYSFIGFGESLQVDVEPGGVYANGGFPCEDVLAGLRKALERAPECGQVIKDQPFSGGLVGASGFDLVRRLYPLPPGPQPSADPEGRYLATESILVFGHLTRRIALLHSGPDAERERLRKEKVGVLRGPVEVSNGSRGHQFSTPAMSKSEFMAGVEKVKDHITAGDGLGRAMAGSRTSGLIIPDLPLEEDGPVREVLEPDGRALVQLVTPATFSGRLQRISNAGGGFDRHDDRCHRWRGAATRRGTAIPGQGSSGICPSRAGRVWSSQPGSGDGPGAPRRWRHSRKRPYRGSESR